jgi:uncharacterized protein YmfQ (DUF2313 family)
MPGFGAPFGHPFGIDLEQLIQAYTRTMIDLLPPGRLWKLIGDTLLRRFFEAAAEELARIHERVLDLLREAIPTTTIELLPDWEETLALAPLAADTEDVRRARVVARLVSRQRVRPQDYRQALAGLLGQAVADVDLRETTVAAAVASGHPREVYRFFIYRNPALANGPGDIAGAQALVDQMSHSHVRGHVIQSISFLCDDPYSLTDRDLLGV